MATTPPKGTPISAFDPANYAIDPKIVKTISIEVARKYKVLPLARVGTSLQVAMVDPSNYRALDDLKFITGFNIEPLRGDEAAILEAIEYAYNAPEENSNPGTNEDLSSVLAAFGDDGDADDGETISGRGRGLAGRDGSGRRRGAHRQAGQHHPPRSRAGQGQ